MSGEAKVKRGAMHSPFLFLKKHHEWKKKTVKEEAAKAPGL